MSLFDVWYTPEAKDDLIRLFDYLLDRAATQEDFDRAEHALNTLQEMVERQLSHHPFAYRKAASNPLLRELVMDLGHTGYVALYEIENARRVNILAVRHQREDDYH